MTSTDSPQGTAIGRADKPWSRETPDGPWDVVVIGSGMGGMTCAALLSKLGRRVLVLEQHYVPGGYTHAFPRKGYLWDVGVHAVGEVTRHTLPGRVLHHLTDGRLRWASLGPVYDAFHFPDGFRIDFPDNPRQFRDNLVAAFPDEEDAVDAFLLRVREVAGTMRSYLASRTLPRRLVRPIEWLIARDARRFLLQRTDEELARLTDDPRLRTVLAAQWGYCGAPPSRSSFAVQALITRHFLHGGYYPEGGSSEIARQLLRTVADAGGWTRILADVDEILLDGNKAVGVRLKDGETIRARRVVSATSVATTVRHLLPPEARAQAWARDVDTLEPGPAHVCLYLGFRGDIRTAGASGANQWFYNTWDSEDDVWEVDDPDALGRPPVLYCSFPSLKDPLHDPGPEQCHTGEVVTFVPWQTFAAWRGTRSRRDRGPEYERLKTAIEDALLEQFLERMPELRPMVDYVELSTPASTDYFVRPVDGSIYGLLPTPERFASDSLRPRSPIRNLFFGGSDAAMVGVIGAMMGGLLAATAAEPLRALRLLRRIESTDRPRA
ncbi:MAG: NAD(P)/FAD-dependent oxidoreductase [Acidobacteriota bacterium]